MNANKADASIRAVEGGILSTQSAYGAVTRAEGGAVTGVTRTAINTGVSASTTQDFVRNQTVSNVAQHSAVETQASSFSFARAAASTDASQRSFAHAFREALANEQAMAYQGAETSGFVTGRGLMRGTDVASTDSASQAMRISSHGRVYMGSETVAPEFYGSDKQAPVRGFAAAGETGGGRSTSAPWGGAQLPAPIGSSKKETGDMHLPVPGAQLSTEMGVDSAQQLLDQATGRSAVQDSRQATHALTQVESALERVATTHADETVRSQARSMQASLARTRTGTVTDTRSAVASQSAVGSLAEARSAGVRTQSDNAVDVMLTGIGLFGSAEAMLRASYDGDQRSTLAAGTYSTLSSAGAAPQTFGTGSLTSAREANVHLSKDAQKTVEGHAAGLSARVGEPSLETPSQIPESSVFAREYAARTQTIADRTASGQRDMDFDRGLLLVAREAYRRGNEEESWALKNAFLGGLGYRSASQMQDDLRRRSEIVPELKQVIHEVGAGEDNKIEPRNWERLVKAARIPYR